MGKKDMTTKNRNLLAQFLLAGSSNGVLIRGKVGEAAALFSLSKRSVYTTWNRIKVQKAAGEPVFLISKKSLRRTAKTVIFDKELMALIPFHKRGTIRDLARALGVSKSTVHRWKKNGLFKAHTNAIKPTLTTQNKFARLKFSLQALYYDDTIKSFKFKPMKHVIHMDEKQFYLTKCMERYYLILGEEEPYRSCQSKRYIEKVMFMCAVSRPIYTEEGELVHDGKIGMWPFTKSVPAQRNSRNRQAGTLITKPVDSVNKEVTKEMLINQIIPAIQAKWPQNASKNIILQWDNARPHINNSDPEFRAAATSNGFNIELQFQPPNSPDTNINDLGWFRSIQSLKTDVQAKTVDQLVTGVKDSFGQLSHKTLNKVFLSLQGCLIEIMKVRGHNNYKIPHLKKDVLQRMGMLPTDLTVEKELVKDCFEYLQEAGCANGLESLMSDLALAYSE